MSASEPHAIIHELMHVVRQASQSLESERQLEDDLEVADTVRYEQGLIDWQVRLPHQGEPLTVWTTHAQADVFSGKFQQSSHNVIIMDTLSHSVLLNPKMLTAISGLLERIVSKQPLATDDYLLKLWLHDICDRHVIARWFIGTNLVFDGYCVRTGQDAVDITTRTETITIPFQRLVAVRIDL
jgi:hypothetical protein